MSVKSFFLSLAFFLCVLLNATAASNNIALKKPVEASTEDASFPASYAVDGVTSRVHCWKTAKDARPPHMLEIDLQKYYSIKQVVIYSGILEQELKNEERNFAAGFFSIKNFKLQYWDDANWTDIPGTEVLESRNIKTVLNITVPVTTFKIRLVVSDGEQIQVMEVEIYGTEVPGMALPYNQTSDKSKKKSVIPKEINVKVENEEVGKSMKYVAYNQGYYLPGSNASGWIEYSNVNAVRIWASMAHYVPEKVVTPDSTVVNIDDFDDRKNKFRNNPESAKSIDWELVKNKFDKPQMAGNAMAFSYALSELNRMNVDVLVQLSCPKFAGSPWSEKWQVWQRFYAMAFYAARHYDLQMYAMQNEPNHHHAGPWKVEDWIECMQIVSDALHCAIDDVNKLYGKNLKAKFVGPVTAGTNVNWWAAIMKAIRTDYHGNTVDYDLVDMFSTHSYNNPAVGYANRVSSIRDVLVENHPKGQALPIVYTEIGRWMNAYLIDKTETMDSPSLFTEWAGIYANNMKNGAYGMWAFKFSNTSTSTYPEGVKSGHHFTWKGQRIVEDAFTNLALQKVATASGSATGFTPSLVVDGNKSNKSAWVSNDTKDPKWIEVDMGKKEQLGAALIYTGSSEGVYTGPDRVKNLQLQYWDNNRWINIAGAGDDNCKYVQVFYEFKKPVETSKVRLLIKDEGTVQIREIKLFSADEVKSKVKPSYDVTSVQRTGEVVRLFAKGFKDERPLLKTTSSVQDNDIDTYTAFDGVSQRYYMWLVQRNMYTTKMSIDLSSLSLQPGATVTVEEVSPQLYGEVAMLTALDKSKKITLKLPAQSVLLVTISNATNEQKLVATENAVVKGGKYATQNFAKAPLSIELNSQVFDNNAAAYIKFDLSSAQVGKMQRAILSFAAKNSTDKLPMRFHVYAIPDANWNQSNICWHNAPCLDVSEALMRDVGQQAHLAGEVVVNAKQAYHTLDVSELMMHHATKSESITFVLIRELRQLGDDEDKGRVVAVDNNTSTLKPVLTIYK